MPELPEIETVKRQLDKKLAGKTIDRVEVLSTKSFQGDPKIVKTAKIEKVRRRAKVLIVDLNNNYSLVIHFKMTGQLIWSPSTENNKNLTPSQLHHRIVGGHPTADWTHSLPSSHTRIIFYFAEDNKTKSKSIRSREFTSRRSVTLEGESSERSESRKGETPFGLPPPRAALYFNDQRKFGWVKLLLTKKIDQLDFFAKLGPEPFAISPQDFYELTQKSSRPIKILLMDQQRISGIGNIYANDALFLAGIDPRRKANQISKPEAQKLHQSIIKVLNDGIKYGGASAADAKYVDLDGLGGHYQDHFRVYQREGEPCPRCRTKIKRLTQSGRSSFFCPHCQK